VADLQLRARVHGTTAEIDAATWNGLLPATGGAPDNPFLEYGFFLALEESGCATRRTGWQPQHILLEDESGAAIGLLPLFLKSHSMGEYVFDHGWADAFERAGGRYYPKLQGSIPFTPVTAPKLLVPSGDPAVRRALLTTAETLCERLDASSVHATFVPEDEAALAVGADWLVRYDTQFHWHNQGYASFEEFLGTLSSRHRKIIRRERRDALADGLTVRWLSGSELTDGAWDSFFEFYEDSGSRILGRPFLNR
jgi:predicted N-acyltransferase